MGRIPSLTLRGATVIGAVALASLASGCASRTAPVAISTNPAINPGYQAGQILGVPSGEALAAALAQVPEPDELGADPRLRAMREAAMAYGARAGLADASVSINGRLERSSADLTRTYDFSRVLIEAPNEAKILPPVISEAVEAWQVGEAGKTLRTADAVYEIVRQARFVSVPPMWQTYLLRTYEAPEPPAKALLPQNRKERRAWEGWVAEGFAKGREQAGEIFKHDLNRLERDFAGMVRYKVLLDQGMVTAPTVSNERLGNTGTGEDMRVNDRTVRIQSTPKLKVDRPGTWTSSPTTPGPDGPVGAGGASPAEAPGAVGGSTRNRTAQAPQRSSRAAW